MKLTPTMVAALLMLAAASVLAEDDTEAASTENAPISSEAAAELPGLTIDRENGHVDLDAQVVLRDGEWLELLACTPNSREHESILTVDAAPRHIHFALLLLGLEPGKPLSWEREEDGGFKVTPPTGPEVSVQLIYEDKGEVKTVDANQWIVNQQNGRVLQESTWLFVGSRFVEFDGTRVYMADPNGSVLSLVNFGDEVLARDTKITKDNDGRAWGANTPVIPKVGTSVTIRLTPVEREPDEDEPAAAPTGRSNPGK